MTTSPRKTVRASDVVTLNSIGLSLHDISRRLKCHHTTVAHKLKTLGIAPADTRRSFMSDIWEELTPSQRKHLVSKLGPSVSIKELIKSLIIKDYLDNQNK